MKENFAKINKERRLTIEIGQYFSDITGATTGRHHLSDGNGKRSGRGTAFVVVVI